MKGPDVPDWLWGDYETAILKFASYGAKSFSTAWPKELSQSFLAVTAFATGLPNFGYYLAQVTEDELDDHFNDER